MCSRALVRDKAHPLKRPQDLAHHTLLHFDYAGAETMYMDWGTWLTALGIGDLKPAGALHFSQYEQMIQAAISGQGVALGRQPLVAPDLKAGRLVVPFEFKMSTEFAYYVVYPTEAIRRRKIKAFRDWVMSLAEVQARAA